MQPDSPTTALPSRFARAVAEFNQRHWRFALVLMLLLLHVAVVRGVSDGWARALLLAHLGLLLLWQPFVRSQAPITTAQAAVIAIIALVVMLRLDWWLLAFWVVVLAGLIGGKVYQFHLRWQRRTYLVVLVYLLALLAVVILPEIAPRREITGEVRTATEYALPLLLVLVAFFPAEADPAEAPQLIDFVYSILLMLLLGVVVLGSFTFMTLGARPYIEALTYTVFAVSGAVLLVALAWSPRTGYGGLEVFVSRYLLSIGLPLERWLYTLAGLSNTQTRPERFLSEGVAALVGLPWVAGVRWRAAQGQGAVGEVTAHSVTLHQEDLELSVYSHFRLSPALQWHLHLIAQLLREFYVAKLREQALEHGAYLRAVHETGARMTHEVKNLLQSLSVLTSVTLDADPERAARAQALLRRELPLITERLAETLEKLRRPMVEPERNVPLGVWWSALRQRHASPGIDFVYDGLCQDAEVPAQMFDGVAENLLQNALRKRAADPSVRTRVELSGEDGPALSVTDTGARVADDVAAHLFQSPVQSARGMGIGLYQSARQAEAVGYELGLENNRDGDVRFALRPRPDVAQGNTPAETRRP